MAPLLGDEAVLGVSLSDFTNTQISVLVHLLMGMYCKLGIVKLSGFKIVLIPVPSLNCYHNLDYIPNPFPSTVTMGLC